MTVCLSNSCFIYNVFTPIVTTVPQMFVHSFIEQGHDVVYCIVLIKH